MSNFAVKSYFWLQFGCILVLCASVSAATPTITSIVPNSGPTAGGTNITINGTNFENISEIWGKQTTGSLNQISNSTATDSSGNVYMAGSFEDTIIFDGVTTLTTAGSLDTWLAKYSPAGTFLWAARSGGTGADIGRAVTTDNSGNVYVTGSFSGTATFGALPTVTSSGGTDTFLVKYNSAGTEQWVRRGGGTGADVAFGAAADSSGSVYITGSFGGTATFGALVALVSAGGTDTFLLKYNSAGTEQWVRRGGGTGADISNGVAIDGSDSPYITGKFVGTAIFGAFSLVSSGSDDAFVIKYGNLGNEQWAYRPTGVGNEVGNGIAIDAAENVLVSGSYSNGVAVGSNSLASIGGGSDVFLFKLSSSGSVIWAKRSGGAGADRGNAVITDAQNNVYISGSFRNTATFGAFSLLSAGNNDVFVVGYSSSGTEIWARKGSGGGDDVGNSLAVDNFSNLYATGRYLSTSMVFGSIILTNATFTNPYLIKYGLATTVSIDSNLCTNTVLVSTTQISCTTPAGTSGPKNVVVANPDGASASEVGGFTYGGQLGFDIRNTSDTATTNSCDLGHASTSNLSSCAYRLKVSSTTANGYTIFMQASGDLSNGTNSISNAAAGTTGTGGHNISGATVGTEKYGIFISPGAITGPGTISRTSAFNAGATNSVNSNSTVSQPIIQASGVNSPNSSDTNNTALITHNLNIASDTDAGKYTQSVTYTLIPNF